MGPVEVTAGAALVLVAVVCVGVWVAVARRRNRRRQDEVERGADDAAVRAVVLRRLEQAAAQWDHTADTAGTVGTSVSAEAADPVDSAASAGTGPVELNGASQEHILEPADNRPVARPEYAPTAAEPARHGRPGRRIRVRWHPRA